MEHKTLQQLEAATIGSRNRMSRRERLERWARLLEGQRHRRLRPLKDIEFVPPSQRRLLRADNSAVTVAFNDPDLRAEGLKGDSYGDAVEFFQISESKAHYILCECHYLTMPSAAEVGLRVRQVAMPLTALNQPAVWATLAGVMTAAAAIAGIGAV